MEATHSVACFNLSKLNYLA